MGIITLTDRISVSVRAKNETESNSQKRATGRNIANALTSGGKANISDSLADQLGNTSKPTIADEQGREWVAMSDIIAAGKKMQQEGAFDEKTTYRYGNVACISVRSLPKKTLMTKQGDKIVPTNHIGYGPTMMNYYKPTWYNVYVNARAIESSSNDGLKIGYIRFQDSSRENKWMIRGLKTSPYQESGFMENADTGLYDNTAGNALTTEGLEEDKGVTWDIPSSIPITTVGNDFYSLSAYGDLHEETSGGSLIDWTKPDDEIEEDIRNLHETWDVSDHAGSVNANGTYVLAGPIEFNPGD